MVKDLAALRHGGQSRLQVRIGPARLSAHHRAGTGHSLDVEAAHGGVELAVFLHCLQHVGEEVVAAEFAVCVHVGVQVHNQPLGGEQAAVQAVEADDVGQVAGHDLGLQLGQARFIVVLGVVLGVIQHLNAVLVAVAVELDDGVPVVPVDVLGGQGQHGLFRAGVIGLLGDGDQLAGAVFVIAVPGVDQAKNLTLGIDGEAGQVVIVHIAADPVEELGLFLIFQLVAVEIGAAGEIQVVFAAAADGVIGVAVKGNVLAQGFGCHIHHGELVAALAPVGDHHPAVVQADELVGVVAHLNGEQLLAGGGIKADDALIAAADHSAVLTGDHGVGGEIAAVSGVYVQLTAGELLAGGVQHAEIVMLLILGVAVPFVSVHLHTLGSVVPVVPGVVQGDELAVLTLDEGADVAAVIMAFHVGIRADRLIVCELGPAAVETDKVDGLLINVVLAFPFGRLVVLLLTHLLGFHGVEAVLGEELGVHRVCAGGEGLVA